MSGTTMSFDVEWCCWAADGWENALEGSVRDARTVTRAQAQSAFAREACEGWIGVRVWKRYIRELTKQERWEWHVERRSEEWDPQYDEENPSWEFVHRSHEDAIPVWICGFKGDIPPVSATPKETP